MKYLVLCVTLVLLFFIGIAHSVTISPHYEDQNLKVVHFVLKQALQLSCNITKEAGDSDFQVKWSRNGEELTGSNKIKISSSGITYTLRIEDTVNDDAGNYSCAAVDDSGVLQQGNITATSKFLVKVVTNQNVVEGDPLTLHCNTVGSPTPNLHWFYYNSTHNITIKEPIGRYNLSADKEGVENAILTVSDIQMFDRGHFVCIGTSPTSSDEEKSFCMVRIKGKYAALWPFLGICAEVFVLCAVIFIYEKKRNKTELEESDTDQSPDQKNTPDHGKDSNLRHRQ